MHCWRTVDLLQVSSRGQHEYPLAANTSQTTPISIYDFEGAVVFQCTAGSYGLVGEYCVPCPVGATCPGAEMYADLVQVRWVAARLTFQSEGRENPFLS